MSLGGHLKTGHSWTGQNRRTEPNTRVPTIWRWTAVVVHALRHALCPSPGLLALMTATERGELGHRLGDGRRKRVLQPVRLSALLERWLLG